MDLSTVFALHIASILTSYLWETAVSRYVMSLASLAAQTASVQLLTNVLPAHQAWCCKLANASQIAVVATTHSTTAAFLAHLNAPHA